VIPNELKEAFKEGLVVILQNLPYRNLEMLRERMFELLERLLEGKLFDKNTCSKHWWFNYQRRNPEIAKLWKGLLLERTVKKGTIKASKKKTEEESSANMTEVSSPVSSSEMYVESPEDVHSISTAYSPSNEAPYQSPMEEVPEMTSLKISEEISPDAMFADFSYDLNEG